MGNIKVTSIEIKENIISVDYTISEDLKGYFNLENKFKVEYGERID